MSNQNVTSINSTSEYVAEEQQVVTSSAEIDGYMYVDRLKDAIRDDFGERCEDHEPECFVCQAWEAWDVLARLYRA